jgi:hypothetical protein
MRLLVTPTTALPYPDPGILSAFSPHTYSHGESESESGLGATALQTGETAASIAATGITTTLSILGALTPTLQLLGLALPVVGTAIAALVTVGIAIANCFKGCGVTCTQATAYANQADTILAQNVDAYTSSPIRYLSMQTAALNTFDTTWAALQQACGQAALGAAGQSCITDRQQGGCKWKASQGGWNQDGTYTPWGAAGSGTVCWNWFNGMRDPIANDPFVQPDPVAGAIPTGAGTTSTTGITGSTPATTTTSGVDSVLSSLGNTVQIGGLSVPLWGLIAAGVGLVMVME